MTTLFQQWLAEPLEQPRLAARFDIGWQSRYQTTILFLSLVPLPMPKFVRITLPSCSSESNLSHHIPKKNVPGTNNFPKYSKLLTISLKAQRFCQFNWICEFVITRVAHRVKHSKSWLSMTSDADMEKVDFCPQANFQGLKMFADSHASIAYKSA